MRVPCCKKRSTDIPPPYENLIPNDTSGSPSTQTSDSCSSSNGSYGGPTKLLQEDKEPWLDKKQVEEALQLLNIAADMEKTGHQQCIALELYLFGLEKLLSALPLSTNDSVKSAVEHKLSMFIDQYQLKLSACAHGLDSDDHESWTSDDPMSLSEIFVKAAVSSAVCLKKSPIPHLVTAVLGHIIAMLQYIDHTCRIRKHSWQLASYGVYTAIRIDQQWQIHQKVCRLMYTGSAAFLKAVLAYTEAPGYRETKKSSSQLA
ncbi:uncharacterized protein BYT42DRAFT_494605 [Radiomyces spectabilis]|uniref:uncharacterized protein n=1 Tax=Radiomyces spectabilis TaxID=64574 RepID=UPI00221F1DA8|nr:uncharacterized protein BYT42DRAFT_494605 [Radiomyces spectabilis]KAI8381508.1 hypothetical protein BYT42DRAFT_494605 [Radiomyces spectabilis]